MSKLHCLMPGCLKCLPDAQFPKRCTRCGALYSKEAWVAMPLVSHQVGELQMRNCVCDGTMAISLHPEDNK